MTNSTRKIVDMPTISTFYGILIQMFWNDHAPPHFHALYADDEVLINIRTLEINLRAVCPGAPWHSFLNGCRTTAPNYWRIGSYAHTINIRKRFVR